MLREYFGRLILKGFTIIFDRYPYGHEELAACDDFDAVCTLVLVPSMC